MDPQRRKGCYEVTPDVDEEEKIEEVDGDDVLNEEDDKAVTLKKNVGLVSGVTLIVGTMIGSGIFVSPRGVLIGGGSVALSVIIWGLSGLLAMMGSLCYAELGAAIPKSGGEHAYLMHTFASLHKCWGPVPGFLFAWLAMFVIRPGMVSIIVRTLGLYAAKPFYGQCEPPPHVVTLLTICALVIIAFINCYSVKFATRVQNVFTFGKLLAVVIITIGGFYYLALGHTQFIKEGFQDSNQSPSEIALGFYNGLWAYDGWNNLNFVTEEMKEPHKNLPRAIMIGIPMVTICYILTNIGYFSVMAKEDILISDAVAVIWGQRVLGVMAWIIPVFVIMSCFGGANGSLFASGRLNYVVAREGHLVQVLSFIHTKCFTPVPAIMYTTLIAIFFIIAFDITSLIEFFSFTAWIFHGLTCTCVLVLRYTQKDLHRPYKVPIFVPVIVIVASFYLIVAPILQNPRIEFLYAFLFVVSGLLVYFPFIYYKVSFPYMDEITRKLQLILYIAPTKHY